MRGAAYVHGQRDEARFVRGGSAPAACVVEGRREEMRRPRVREKVGDTTREKGLASYAGLRDPGAVRLQSKRPTDCR